MIKFKLGLITTDARESFHRNNSADPSFGTAVQALLEGFSFLNEVEIHVLSCLAVKRASPKKLYPNIFFHSLYVPRCGWLRSFYSGCAFRIRQKAAELGLDLLHSQGTERECAMAALASRLPKVLTIHGNCRAISIFRQSPFLSFWWLQARLEKFCLPRFDGVVCISRYTQHLVSDLARRTWLLPNAVDSNFFDLCHGTTPPVPVVLVVANVDSRKNQIGLIRALHALSKLRRFEVRFFGKCGDDAYGKEFRQLVDSNPWCYFGGMVDRTKLREEIAKAATVMLPTWEDNCPMVVLEAQAAGIPVIASNVGGVPDLIQDEVTGILTDPTQPETMPKALARLWDHPELAWRLVEQGKKQARARFHPQVVAQKHLEIYREVIASR